MIDQERWIGAMAVMKSIIERVPIAGADVDSSIIKPLFDHCVKIMEEYATLSTDDELIDSGIEIPKQYWNLPTAKAKQEWLTEWGRQKKNEDTGWWYVACRKSDLPKLKKAFEARDNSFDEMVSIQTKKETK